MLPSHWFLHLQIHFQSKPVALIEQMRLLTLIALCPILRPVEK